MSVSTRQRILEAAERLFAERGIGPVSLREIGTVAGQRNNSAVQYHFGSKQRLVSEIFKHRMGVINARRLQLLEAVERSPRSGTGDIRPLVDVLVRPVAEAVGERGYYIRFVAHAFGDPAGASLIRLDLEVMEGLRRLWRHLEPHLHHVPQSLRQQRMILVGRFFIEALAQYERELHGKTAPTVPLPVMLNELVDMIVGALQAPVAAATRRGVRRTGGKAR